MFKAIIAASIIALSSSSIAHADVAEKCKTLDCGKLYVASVTTEVKPGVKVTRTRTMMLVSSAKLIVAMDK